MTGLPVLVQGVDLQKGSANFDLETLRISCFLLNTYKTSLRSVVYKLAFLLISFSVTITSVMDSAGFIGGIVRKAGGSWCWPCCDHSRTRWGFPGAGLYPGVHHLCVAMFCVCTGDRTWDRD